MFDRLKHQMKRQRERRLTYHATAHLSPHILRDIGMMDARTGPAHLQLTAYRDWR